MKKALLKFASSIMSKEQMKSIKGGSTYCLCDGVQVYNSCPNLDCGEYCACRVHPFGCIYCH